MTSPTNGKQGSPISGRVVTLLRAARSHPFVLIAVAVGAILAFTADATKNFSTVWSQFSAVYEDYLGNAKPDMSVTEANTDGVLPAAARDGDSYMVVCELGTSLIIIGPQRDYYANMESRLRNSLEDSCHTAFEAILADYGHTIVDRQNLPVIIEELKFQTNSGLVDQSARSKIGHLTPAQNILSVHVQPQIHAGQYDGYGITTFKVDGKITLVARRINVESGETVTASETFALEETLLEPNQNQISIMAEDLFFWCQKQVGKQSTAERCSE